MENGSRYQWPAQPFSDEIFCADDNLGILCKSCQPVREAVLFTMHACGRIDRPGWPTTTVGGRRSSWPRSGKEARPQGGPQAAPRRNALWILAAVLC